ncbi:MAG: exosortase/archaeosortase family protein [Bryobacteraceae bacterium]
MTRRHLYLLSFTALWLVSFWRSLSAVGSLSLRDSHYSHTLLIPAISMLLIYLERKKIFVQSRYCLLLALPLVVAGVLGYFLDGHPTSPMGADGLYPTAFFALVTWVSGFGLFYGLRALRAAAFPLSLLLLSVPIPRELIAMVERGLQEGTADATHLLFELASVPVLRDGLRFSLPGVDLEIAAECSGIRSSTALLITCLVASHLFLQSTWRKACLVLFSIPVTILKNALRVATISWLGIHVSPDYFSGAFHRNSGLPFSLLALALLAPLLFWLMRRESHHRKHPTPAP